MEGTVTISLKDYKELMEVDEARQSYLNTAIKQVELLEKIEDFLQGEKIAAGLADEINLMLAKWYG